MPLKCGKKINERIGYCITIYAKSWCCFSQVFSPLTITLPEMMQKFLLFFGYNFYSFRLIFISIRIYVYIVAVISLVCVCVYVPLLLVLLAVCCFGNWQYSYAKWYFNASILTKQHFCQSAHWLTDSVTQLLTFSPTTLATTSSFVKLTMTVEDLVVVVVVAETNFVVDVKWVNAVMKLNLSAVTF